MDVSSAFMVAMLFIVILSLGLANILTALAGIADRRSKLQVDRIHLSWTILLLLIFFDLFWHTVDLFGVETWRFRGFVYFATGPILAFLASSMIMPSETEEGPADPRASYFAMSPQFFLILAALQVWILGADLVLGRGFVRAGWINVAGVALALVLAASRKVGVHVGGTVAAWALVLLTVVLRGMGVI